MDYTIGIGIGIVAGTMFGYFIARAPADSSVPVERIALSLMGHELAKLGQRIHNQRLVIRKLSNRIVELSGGAENIRANKKQQWILHQNTPPTQH